MGKDMSGDIIKLRDVVDKADKLVQALEAATKDMDGVFVMAHVHGYKYSGKTYGEELEALKQSIKNLEETKQ